jgi:hypothetical protein
VRVPCDVVYVEHEKSQSKSCSCQLGCCRAWRFLNGPRPIWTRQPITRLLLEMYCRACSSASNNMCKLCRCRVWSVGTALWFHVTMKPGLLLGNVALRLRELSLATRYLEREVLLGFWRSKCSFNLFVCVWRLMIGIKIPRSDTAIMFALRHLARPVGDKDGEAACDAGFET